MILPLLALGAVLGALGAVTAFAVLAFWDEIVNWLEELFTILEKIWDEVCFAVKKVSEGVVDFIQKLYYQEENGKWMEQTTTREIPENQVPAHIRKKYSGTKETDVTNNMKKELALQLR